MAYMALYRQWRPQNFDSLIGQQAIKTALTNALSTGRIAHAYLFTGPRGTGKTSTARILAKALNCEQGPTPTPCDHCDNCQRITAGTSMDVIEIDAASNRGIDEIKTLRDQLSFAPVNSRYKVYIIDEVHMLTTEAFNALLKSLEEPPEHVVFILATTDPHKVPATIHSRCQRFDFRRVTVEDIIEHLAMVAQASNITIDQEALRLIAIQAEGGMRDALSLLDQCGVMSKNITTTTVREVLGIVGREALRDLAASIGRQDLSAALEKLNFLLEQGKDVRQVISELAEYLRALLLYKTAPSFSEIYLTDTEEALAQGAALFSEERLLAAEERLHTAAGELRGTIKPRITAELCLIDLCRIEGSTLAALCARVEQLEHKLAYGVPAAYTPSVQPPYVDTVAQQNIEQQVSQQVVVVPKAQEKAKQYIDDYNDFLDNIPEEEEPPSMEELAFLSTTPPQKNESVVQHAANSKIKAVSPKAVEIAAKSKMQNKSNEDAADGEEYAGDIAAGEDYWNMALEILNNENKRAMVSLSKNGRVYSFVNGLLRIAFEKEFLADRMNKDDYRQAFEDALLRVARQPIRVEAGPAKKFKQLQNQYVDSKPKPVANTASAEDASVVDEQNLPEKLRKAMDVFGGKITINN